MTKLLTGSLLFVIITGLLGASLSPAFVSAQGEPPPVTEAFPGRLPHDGLFDAPRLPSAAVTQDVPQALLAPEYANWSKLVFQSARNQRDWEVYSASGDGGNQANLSNNSAADLHPRLNRGATRVVFASKRPGNYDIYVMNADGSGQSRLTTNSADDVSPAWSRGGSQIVFQAYRNGQAEIYVMNADGSGQTRLTNHSDYDGQPAWSPDGTQIAFVRRLNGANRIWLMNADGSNPHQVSGQISSENPAWSPDGSQIAYDADGNGDGWQEIWLMDAAGGNQRQVYDPPEPDTDAWVRSWSPDGRYIAFTRIAWTYYQNQWYWTTAYLDALDPQNPHDAMRLSSNGADWNPDWQTTDILAPKSSMQPLPALSGSPFFLGWSGDDVGPAGIATFDLQVKDGVAGAWTNWMVGTPNTPTYYHGFAGHTYYFRMRARDNAGNVEAWPPDYQTFTTVESMPPRSSVQPLPQYTWTGNATMSWDGQDFGGSTILTFELQCRDGAAGAWQGCGSYSAPGSAAIPSQPGHTIFIRSRAIDTAGNIEAWPSGDGDARTTIYTGKVSGTVRDNADIPVVGITAVMTPINFTTISDAPDGSYHAYASEDADTIQVSLGKTGYGNLPPTTLSEWPEAIFHGILPPADNQVRNWGFEEDLAPSWEAGGSALAVRQNWAIHSGQRGVALGWPFTGITNVSNLLGYTWFSDAIGDNDGGLHVVWQEGDPSGHGLGIRYAHRTAGGTWSAPEIVSSGPYSGGPLVAVDQTGTAYVVWTEAAEGSAGEVLFRLRGGNGQWSAATNVSNTPSTSSGALWLRLDNSGALHLFWQEGSNSETWQIYYAWRSVSGAWSTPTQVSNAASYGARFQSAAVTNDGEAAVTWGQWIGGVGSYIFYAHRGTNGAWSAPQQLFPGEGARLLVDPADQLHMIWINGDAILYANRTAVGSWSTAETVVRPNPGYAIRGRDMAVDGLGVIHLAVSSGDDIKYLRRDASNTWSQEGPISTPDSSNDVYLALDSNRTVYLMWRSGWNGYYYRAVSFARRGASGAWSGAFEMNPYMTQIIPKLVVDGHDRLHLIWSAESAGGSDVFHALYVGTPPAGDSWLRQQLTIPTSTVNPGLSFLYKLQQGNADDKNPFSITIRDGASTNTVFSTSAVAADWTHRWISLAPWRGETVTVTANLQNAADNSPTVVYLDEVSIGSTYPDTWVRQFGHRAAMPGQQLIHDITYGNRGGVTANDTHITLQLPPEFLFVSADPPPSATAPELRWDVGDLAAQSATKAIHVTLQVASSAAPGTTVVATASIASGTAEIEQTNNTAQAATFIGHLLYLPSIAR